MSNIYTYNKCRIIFLTNHLTAKVKLIDIYQIPGMSLQVV